MNKIELGDTVQCILTGFKGVVVAKSEFINGCIQYTITPKCSKDNKYPEAMEIDENSLKVISQKKKEVKKEVKKEENGGPVNLAKSQKGY